MTPRSCWRRHPAVLALRVSEGGQCLALHGASSGGAGSVCPFSRPPLPHHNTHRCTCLCKRGSETGVAVSAQVVISTCLTTAHSRVVMAYESWPTRPPPHYMPACARRRAACPTAARARRPRLQRPQPCRATCTLSWARRTVRASAGAPRTPRYPACWAPTTRWCATWRAAWLGRMGGRQRRRHAAQPPVRVSRLMRRCGPNGCIPRAEVARLLSSFYRML